MVPPLVVVQLRHAHIRLPSQTAGPVGCVAMYLSEDELPLIAWQPPSFHSQTVAEGEMPISESNASNLELCSSGAGFVSVVQAAAAENPWSYASCDVAYIVSASCQNNLISDL